MVGEMSHVEIIGPTDLFDSALDATQQAGILHIEEIPLAEYGERGVLHRIQLSESQADEI